MLDNRSYVESTGQEVARPPLTSIELVIFDCDGVLVDSEPIAVRVDQAVLRRVGLEMSDAEVVDRFVGRSPEVMRQAIADHLGAPLAPAVIDEFEQLYRDAFAAELEAVDGVHEALARIEQAKCVASSSEPEHLRWKLNHVGLLDQFEGRIFSAAEVRNGKPAPDLFLYAAERMGVSADRCAVVEDSVYGVLAARSAGMDVFAYATGFIDPQRLVGARTTLFSDMRDLPGLMRGERR